MVLKNLLNGMYFLRKKKNFENKNIKNSVYLLSSSILVMVFMLLSNFILTKIFDKESFGNFYLILSIYTFSVILVELGFFYTLGNLISTTKTVKDEREYYGVGLIIILIQYFLLTISLVLFSVFFDFFKNENLLNVFLITVPFSFVYLLIKYNELLLRGSNKIELLSLSKLLPRVFFFIILIILYKVLGVNNINLEQILVFYFISLIVVFCFVLVKLKPKLIGLRHKIFKLYLCNKFLGFNIYIGSLFSLGANALTMPIISYFNSTNVEVGYYSISLQISSVMVLFSNTITSVAFKEFAESSKIPLKWLKALLVLYVFALLGVFLFAKFIVLIIYGDSYLPAVNLIKIMSIGYVFYGVSDFYAKYFLAKNKGRILRNTSFIIGVFFILFNIIFIKYYGAVGASIALLLSGIIYLSLMIYNIKK